jgi:ribosomal protein S18 acetylase RimI-like enzyme
MKFEYRIGTIRDKADLQKLGLISYGQFKDVLTPENWQKLQSFLTAEDSYSPLLKVSRCFVCEHAGEVVGMAFLIPNGNPTEVFRTEWSYIRMVGVNPKFAGKGIGKTLTQMCIDRAKETKEEIIALHTSEFMDAARHIYERLGFKRIKELEPRLGKRYWLYQLEITGNTH